MNRIPHSLWAFAAFFLFLWVVVWIPAHKKVKDISKQVICRNHLSVLSDAVRIYAHDHKGMYPTRDRWGDLILAGPGGLAENALHCPMDSGGIFSYAMNEAVYECEPNQIPAGMVVLFEADLGRNGIGGRHDAILRHKQGGRAGCHVGFADGHTEFVTEDRVADLLWTAKEE